MYPTEIMRGQGSCSYNEQTDTTNDPRYLQTGLYTNEYDVQVANGVYDILKSQTKYAYNVPDYVQKKTDILYQGWIRPTISWNLECEWNGFTRE